MLCGVPVYCLEGLDERAAVLYHALSSVDASATLEGLARLLGVASGCAVLELSPVTARCGVIEEGILLVGYAYAGIYPSLVVTRGRVLLHVLLELSEAAAMDPYCRGMLEDEDSTLEVVKSGLYRQLGVEPSRLKLLSRRVSGRHAELVFEVEGGLEWLMPHLVVSCGLEREAGVKAAPRLCGTSRVVSICTKLSTATFTFYRVEGGEPKPERRVSTSPAHTTRGGMLETYVTVIDNAGRVRRMECKVYTTGLLLCREGGTDTQCIIAL